MNKKILGVAVIVLAIGITLFINNKHSNQVAQGETVKIGVIAPLTGPLAEYGEAFKNGITLAQNDSQNKKIQFIFEDSAYDSVKAISAFNKLKDSDKVTAIINWGDPTSQSLAPLFAHSDMPFIAVTTIPSVSDTSSSTVRTLNNAETMANATWVYLRSMHYKNIAIIKLESAYFNNLLAGLQKTKNADETITVVDTYLSFGDKDFRTSISKIKNSAIYDSVGVFLAGGQISQFYNQAAAIGLKTPTFGTDFFESQSDIDAAGKNINGAVYVNYSVSDAFKNTYQNKYKNISQIAYAGNGYDTAMMLNSTLKLDAESIVSTLKSIKNYEGVLGSWSYIESSHDRYLTSPFHVKVIQDGLIKTLN